MYARYKEGKSNHVRGLALAAVLLRGIRGRQWLGDAC